MVAIVALIVLAVLGFMYWNKVGVFGGGEVGVEQRLEEIETGDPEEEAF